ncbi:UDP-glucose 4-epimerase Gal10 [Microthyrium microscopicum]|uniref:DNA-directed RNA polymerases I, II, and III subunit RPABC3 n=1 Tax=Microthyrium microscopicum TaxID=703497 RepID=A0A6A6UJV9_9PEZI|nr:UDP-glucose 4-epimerase Gal10 [Microthyrium microscopicum]
MTDATLYEDTFSILEYNPGKYDRVARVSGTSVDGNTKMDLDVNIELYPVAPGDQVQILITSTLNLDGSKEEDTMERGGWRETKELSIADQWDYVCYGKVYKFDESDSNNIKVYVSFGGLLLCFEGPYKKLTPMRVDHAYLCMKK